MRATISLILLLIFLIGNSFKGDCQKAITHYNGSKTISYPIESHIDDNYKLQVTTPPGYSPDTRYDVIYYLDAWWLEDLVRGSYVLNFLSHNVEPVILVGIAVDGNEDEWNVERNRDYTISPYDISKMKVTMNSGNVPLNAETTGGAGVFLTFMQSEVFPFVESHYDVNSNNRGFIGHSFGGLFGAYVLMTKPELFKNFILISPSLWWNRSEILSEAYMLSLQKLESPKNVFIGVGSEESGMLVKAIWGFQELVENIGGDVNLNLKTYEGADHQSLLPQAIYDGIDGFYRIGLRK